MRSYRNIVTAELEKAARSLKIEPEGFVSFLSENLNSPLIKTASEVQHLRKLACDSVSSGIMSSISEAVYEIGLDSNEEIGHYAIVKTASSYGLSVDDIEGYSFLTNILSGSSREVAVIGGDAMVSEYEKLASSEGVSPSIHEAISVLEDAGLLD